MITYLVTNYGPGDPTQLTTFTSGLDQIHLKLLPLTKKLTATQEALKAQLFDYQMATSLRIIAFHTMFNLINTFIMIWFANIITKLVSFVVKKKESDEEFQLKYISTGMLSTSELSLLQAWEGESVQRTYCANV